MRGEDVTYRGANRAELWGIQARLRVHRRVPAGQHELIPLAQRHFELLGEVQNHFATRRGPAGLHETEVSARDLRLQRKLQLSQSPTFAPLTQKLAIGPGAW